MSSKSRKHGKLDKDLYFQELRNLQIELCHLQNWVKKTGARVVVIFEGRDAAGKGGVIRTLTEKVSPRVFRVVALPAPDDREKTQYYMQRYIQHLPAAGEVVLFDRSWYNRAGVEHVMGFCSEEEYNRFLRIVPAFEKTLLDENIQILKYWLEISNEQQEARFTRRMTDPTRQWKLSPMDLESRARWYQYSHARDDMLNATDTTHCPWHIVPFDCKKRGRLNLITHMLAQIPYEPTPSEVPEALPKRSKRGAYDDAGALQGRSFIPGKW
jgi:polyphosphate kinase 2